MTETVIKIQGLKKKYRLGAIGGGTLSGDLQSWWAKKRGKEDPNTRIGEKQYEHCEDFWALDGIDLEVKKGEALGIIGMNGAGKSTLLKILSRVTAPTEGDVYIKGRIVSMLEVGTGFHGEMTGRENIYMNGAILGMNKKEIDSKIDDIIEFSECGKFIDTPVKRYSSGMYVKLAFAVAAHLDSDIMVMDEVLAVGDVKFQKKCLGKMGDAANTEGKTVLYVSHNMQTIRQLCTRCIVLSHGKIIYDGTVEKAIEIYEGLDGDTTKNYYDLNQVKRPSLDHGRLFKLTELEFIDKKDAVFKNTEIMRIGIKWNSSIQISDLQLLLTVRTRDDRMVGMAMSERFNATSENGKKGIVLDFDISNIVAGAYYFGIDVVLCNEFGTYTSYDFPLKHFCFDIESDFEKHDIQWQDKYWGNVRLNDLTIE